MSAHLALYCALFMSQLCYGKHLRLQKQISCYLLIKANEVGVRLPGKRQGSLEITKNKRILK